MRVEEKIDKAVNWLSAAEGCPLRQAPRWA
jgi:hypothetical protein